MRVAIYFLIFSADFRNSDGTSTYDGSTL